MGNKKIYVTQPLLPPLEEFYPYLEKIWDSKVLTNGGPFHQELEEQLCNFLGIKHISLFNNGTIALVTALQALGISGEVITTPYSFVATTNSLIWNNIKPIFVDIDESTFNINPNLIEAAITNKTTAILAVHCYGNPCDVDSIEQIASRHKLKVIYDAAHAFGVKCHCGSILNHGDLSVLSFHATKVFNTFEGGAIVSNDLATKKHIDNLKNFGFINETTIVESGINGKMSELNAAVGLAQLKHIDQALSLRRKIAAYYNTHLENIAGIKIPELNYSLNSNYSYYPVLITPDFSVSRDKLYERLKMNNIYSRRYFFPLISNLDMYRSISTAAQSNLPVSNKISDQILCLPIYPTLQKDDLDKIISIISGSIDL